MAITDINISEELMTDAPSIKYRGEEGPKSPQQEQRIMVDSMLRDEYEQYVYDLLEQRPEATPMSFEEFRQMVIAEGLMSGGQPLPQDPTKPVNPFQPKPTGPVLPDRQMAAYGGIMGLDGRKQYGIGSWFQENVMDNYKKYVLGQTQEQIDKDSRDRVNMEDAMYGKNYESPIDTFFKGKRKDPDDPDSERTGGQAANILPAIGGIVAGLFTKKNEDGTSDAMTADETALALADLKKSANILDQKQGMAAGLNFLPAVSARKFTPQEMIETYETESAANGGRIGFAGGKLAQLGITGSSRRFLEKVFGKEKFARMIENDPELHRGMLEVVEMFRKRDKEGLKMYMQKFLPHMDDATVEEFIVGSNPGIEGIEGQLLRLGSGRDYAGKIEMMKKAENMRKLDALDVDKMKPNAYGGRISKQEGGLMDLGGMEKDYRAEGGFVPIGRKEKADDVPARLSVNEFVFTADAVRNAGGGDVDKGAEVMENMMKHLEAGGQVSEESQGMAGARDMFATSQRLSEVV